MKRYIILLFFICSIAYGDFKISEGIKLSLEQNLYDAIGESFKTKMQFGGGFESIIRFTFNEITSFDISIPGIFYIAESDSLGSYIYPEKLRLPFSFDFLLTPKFENFQFEFGLGFSLSYIMLFSYYFPRSLNPALSGSIGLGYNFNDKTMLLLSVKGINFYDELSALNFSICYSLTFYYRIF